MANPKKGIIKRQSTRFEPSSEDSFAEIELADDFKSTKDFLGTYAALVIEEAYKGCGIVGKTHSKLKAGVHCRIRVGKLPPLYCEIRWRKDIGDGLMKMGILYLE